jgi:hypothetical protein
MARSSYWSRSTHARCWQHRRVPSSSTRPRAWQARIGASSSSASTTSSSASTPMTALTTSPTILLAYSVLAKPQYAYAPDVRLVLAQLWPHLVLDSSDCIDFSIIILDDCPRRVSVIITMAPSLRPRLQVWLHRHRQPRPRHRPWHPLARLPRPRLQHPPLSATSISAQGLPPRLSSHQLPLQSNMVLYMFFFFLLPKGVLKRLDFSRSRFFWHGEDGVWQTLLRRKYVGSEALSQVLWKPGDSHF